MLNIENLVVQYGNIQALHGVSLYVREGEMVALIGANGAGKSTTLMAIMRVAPPEGPVIVSGKIQFKGVDINGIATHQVVANHRISLVPEGRRIFGNLTVMENLTIATYARVDKNRIEQDYKRVFDLFPRLYDRRYQRGDTLSGGEQQMLAMGRAFMSGANWILLDEPSMGLSPLLMQELFKVLKQLNDSGTTIFIVEQNIAFALAYSHRAYVMETGRIVMEGLSKDLSENPEIIKAYLGT